MIRLVMLMLQLENENILSTNMQKNKQLFLKNTVVSIEKKNGSVAVKCEKKFIFCNVIFFCLKLPNSSRKPIKKILYFITSYTSKCKIRNVRVQHHDQYFCHLARLGRLIVLYNYMQHVTYLLKYSQKIPLFRTR